MSIKIDPKYTSLDSKKYNVLDDNAKPVTAIEYTGYSLQELHLEYDQSLLLIFTRHYLKRLWHFFFDFCKWLSYVKLFKSKPDWRVCRKLLFSHEHLPNLIQKISNSCRVSGNKALQIMADISLNKIWMHFKSEEKTEIIYDTNQYIHRYHDTNK